MPADIAALSTTAVSFKTILSSVRSADVCLAAWSSCTSSSSSSEPSESSSESSSVPEPLLSSFAGS